MYVVNWGGEGGQRRVGGRGVRGQMPNTILSLYYIIVLLGILLMNLKLLLSISTLYQRFF